MSSSRQHEKSLRARKRGMPKGVANARSGFDSETIGTSAIDIAFSPSSYEHFNTDSGSSSAVQSLTSASTLSTLESKLDLSPSDAAARKGLLRDTVFDKWKNDATDVEAQSAEELQENDPLGTQIWKLYSKQKSQLPNSERMENLSWRMMSMNLRRKELERQA